MTRGTCIDRVAIYPRCWIQSRHRGWEFKPRFTQLNRWLFALLQETNSLIQTWEFRRQSTQLRFGPRLRMSRKTSRIPFTIRMPRLVVPEYPHHVTQRGNRRMNLFFCDDDYRACLRLRAVGKTCAASAFERTGWATFGKNASIGRYRHASPQ